MQEATYILTWLLILAALVTLGFAIAFLHQGLRTARSLQVATEKLSATLDDVRDLTQVTTDVVRRSEVTLANLEASAAQIEHFTSQTTSLADTLIGEVTSWMGTIRAVRTGVAAGLGVLGALMARRAHDTERESDDSE